MFSGHKRERPQWPNNYSNNISNNSNNNEKVIYGVDSPPPRYAPPPRAAAAAASASPPLSPSRLPPLSPRRVSHIIPTVNRPPWMTPGPPLQIREIPKNIKPLDQEKPLLRPSIIPKFKLGENVWIKNGSNRFRGVTTGFDKKNPYSIIYFVRLIHPDPNFNGKILKNVPEELLTHRDAGGGKRTRRRMPLKRKIQRKTKRQYKKN